MYLTIISAHMENNWTAELAAALEEAELEAKSLPLHRFRQPVADEDVVLASDGSGDVLPPPWSPAGIVGVSFFVPLSNLSKAAHYYFANKSGAASPCQIRGRVTADDAPYGLGSCQDRLLEFTPVRGAASFYPSSFQSMSSTLRKGRHIHGLHYSVFPTVRMARSEFNAKVEQLQHHECDWADMKGGGSDSDNDNDNDSDSNKQQPDGVAAGEGSREWWTNAVEESKAWLPSTQPMRLINEALWHFALSPTTHANNALLAYMLTHHFGASDVSLPDLLHDSTVARLVYHAVSEYPDKECAVPNAEAVQDDVLYGLERVLPLSLHRERPSVSDHDTGHKVSRAGEI
jgi:hypothetical protein